MLLFVIMALSQSANDTGMTSKSDDEKDEDDDYEDYDDDDDNDDIIPKQSRISPPL